MKGINWAKICFDTFCFSLLYWVTEYYRAVFMLFRLIVVNTLQSEISLEFLHRLFCIRDSNPKYAHKVTLSV